MCSLRTVWFYVVCFYYAMDCLVGCWSLFVLVRTVWFRFSGFLHVGRALRSASSRRGSGSAVAVDGNPRSVTAVSRGKRRGIQEKKIRRQRDTETERDRDRERQTDRETHACRGRQGAGGRRADGLGRCRQAARRQRQPVTD